MFIEREGLIERLSQADRVLDAASDAVVMQSFFELLPVLLVAHTIALEDLLLQVLPEVEARARVLALLAQLLRRLDISSITKYPAHVVVVMRQLVVDDSVVHIRFRL